MRVLKRKEERVDVGEKKNERKRLEKTDFSLQYFY